MTAPTPAAVAAVVPAQPAQPTPATGTAPPADPQATPAAPAEGQHGYPENTPVAEMTVPQQASYWKARARANEAGQRAAQAALEAAKPKIEGYDALEASTKTDQERAVENAKKEADAAARADERSRGSLALVGAEFRAAAKGVLAPEALAGLLEDIDRSKYVLADGTVDLERIEKRVTELAPKPADPAAPLERKPADLGQGRRTPAATSGLDTGKALYEQTHPRKTAST